MAKKVIIPELTPRQESVFQAVQIGNTTCASVSKMLGKDPGNISRVLKRLVALGILESELDENDFRITHYSVVKKEK